MKDEEPFRWRHVLICGLLWDLVVIMAVSLMQPVAGLSWKDWLMFLASVGFNFGPAGPLWAAAAKIAQASRRPILSILILALLVSSSMFVFTSTRIFAEVPGNFGRLSISIPRSDLGVFVLWNNLFYGGLYTFGYFASRRARRLRRRLAQIRLTRSEAEARLRENRLQAVRGQLQPAMLLEALGALRLGYARSRSIGDRLFDLLIAFLRAAMPGLRSGSSTLSTELAILAHYAALRTELDGGPPEWRLAFLDPPPELAFPPLRLLPALDRMSRATPAHAAVDVRAERELGDFVLRVDAPASPPLSDLIIQRLRASMRIDLGTAGRLSSDLAGSAIAELRISLP